jgi:hypothetical protein
VLAPTVYWAAVAAVRPQHGWVPAVAAFAVSLLWVLLVLGMPGNPLMIASVLGSAIALLVLARFARWRTRTVDAPASA